MTADPSETTNQDTPDDLPTLAAIGVAAAMLVTVAHELVGHGSGCLAAGGRVLMVSTLIFRCDGGNGMTDLAGPLGGLALGLLALAAMASRRVVFREGRLFLLITAALTLFWFFGQLFFAALGLPDDWGYGAGQQGWPPFWRVVGAVVGLGGYDVTRRALTRAMRTLSTGRGAAADRRRFLTPWLAGLATTLFACALFSADRAFSLVQGGLTLGALPLGLILAVGVANRLGPTGPETPKPIRRRWSWLVAVGLAYIVYCATMGLGMGPGVASYG